MSTGQYCQLPLAAVLNELGTDWASGLTAKEGRQAGP